MKFVETGGAGVAKTIFSYGVPQYAIISKKLLLREARGARLKFAEESAFSEIARECGLKTAHANGARRKEGAFGGRNY